MTDTAFSTSSRGQVPCTYHPNVQTGLRCTRCGKPICPQCSVRTPVGLRCPECAGVRGLPTIRTAPSVLLRAGGAALIVGAITTILWYLFPEWKFYLSLLLGFGVAESIAYVAKGKRGRDLQILGLAVVTIVVIAVRVVLIEKYGIASGMMLSDELLLVSQDGQFPPLTSEEFSRFGISANQLSSGMRVFLPGLGWATAGTPRQFLQTNLIPDLLFVVTAWAIAWVRFR